MRADIEEVLWQCKIFEKFSTTSKPLKFVIPVTVKETLSTWFIDAGGLIRAPNNDANFKKDIITTVKYSTR